MENVTSLTVKAKCTVRKKTIDQLLAGIAALAFILLYPDSLSAQSRQLTVVNGYGTGSYLPGDTVHFWAQNNPPQTVFGRWASEVPVTDSLEWHSTLVMPDRDITISASFTPVQLPLVSFEKIQGVELLKNVYSAFPAPLKGVVFCFHGTGGSATNWTQAIEYRQFVNDLLAAGYGVIITEADEVTLQQDLNNDGGLRWSPYPVEADQNNDIGNISALLDTFRIRGELLPSTPVFATGMSNGGAFAPSVSFSLGFTATAIYCASGAQLLFKLTEVPTAWFMQKYDQHEQVGDEGNKQALELSTILADREICSEYHLNDHSPVHAQRFMRGGYIPENTAINIFNELKNNSILDDRNYLLYTDLQTDSIVKSRPGDFPVITGLFPGQQLVVLAHLANCFADHHFFSDYSRRTIRFFDNLCSTPSGISSNSKAQLKLYPNPAESEVILYSEGSMHVEITDAFGRRAAVYKCTTGANRISLSLSSGVYFVHAQGYPAHKLVVQ